MWIAVCIGAAIGVGWIAISYAMEPLFPMGDWRWLVLAAIAFGVAGVAYFLQRRRERRSRLGPEIRLNDTTTYREQPDGSRVVTQTTLARPVSIKGIGATSVEGASTAKVTRVDPAKVRERMEQAARDLRGEDG